MAKLSRKSRAAREAVAAAVGVAATSSSPEPSPEPPRRVAVTRTLRRSTSVMKKDANPAPPPHAASLAKRKQEHAARLPNKRPRQEKPGVDHETVGSGDDSDLDPAALDAINAFSKGKARNASRTRTPQIEVHLRSSNDMAGRYALRPGKRVKLTPPIVPSIPEDHDEDENQEGGLQPELEPGLGPGHEDENMGDAGPHQNTVPQSGPGLGAEGEHELPEDALLIQQTRPSPTAPGHVQGSPRRPPRRKPSQPLLSKPQLGRPRGMENLYDVYEIDDMQGVQVSSNPSSTSTQPKQTINGLQAPQVRRNVMRLPPKPWTSADDDGFGYPDDAPRAKKKHTAGGNSRKAPSRLETSSRPPVTAAPAPAPAPRVRVRQHQSLASRGQRSPTLEPARQRRPAADARRGPSPEQTGRHPPDSASESDTAEETDDNAQSGPTIPTVQMSSTAVVAMHQIMGRVGWTNRQKRWAKHLAPGAVGLEHDTPGITNLGRELFKHLTNLNMALNKIPKAPYLRKQAKYLVTNDKELRKPFFESRKLLTKIREERLAPIGESDRRANGDLDQRRGMVHDVLHYLMPMLVQAVWSAFSLGGVEHDDQGRVSLSEEGIFTETTLAYVVKLSHWMNALMVTLEVELAVRPFEDESAAGKKEKDKTRESFRHALDNWMLEFEEAQEAMDELATADERKRRQREEDLRIKEARRKAELEVEAETERRWREMAASTQRIAQLPNPFQEKWERAAGPSRPSTASTSSGRLSSDAGRSAPGRPRPRGTPAAVQYAPWPDEDRAWLLIQLRDSKGIFPRRRNGQPSDEELDYFAETLDHPVEEVKLEIEVHQQACRSLARERGIPIEPWAAL